MGGGLWAVGGGRWAAGAVWGAWQELDERWSTRINYPRKLLG